MGKRTGLELNMRRGEVRLYKFKTPDKERPVVILSRNSAIEYLGEITVAPITSKIRDIPTEVILSERDGMRMECAINLYHIQTVPKGKIGKLITTLSEEKVDRIREVLLFALEF